MEWHILSIKTFYGNIYIQFGPIEVFYLENYEHLDMKCFFCEKKSFFPQRFFFFPNPERKKKTVKSFFLEVGRRSNVITKKIKNQPPLLYQIETI